MELALNILGLYALIGIAFAIAFVFFGVHRVDHAAAGTGFMFRLLILPATAALWPLMLTKWARSKA